MLATLPEKNCKQETAIDQFRVLAFSTETKCALLEGPEQVQKQNYAKIDARIDLVRIENSDGHAFRNDFTYDYFRLVLRRLSNRLTLGSRFVVVRSGQILRARTWLGSVDRGIYMREAGGELEPMEFAKRVKEVLA